MALGACSGPRSAESGPAVCERPSASPANADSESAERDVTELSVLQLGEPIWTVRSDEETFSSPQVVDLNGDGVFDVVQGFGQDTFGQRASSVAAFDGRSGDQLWRSSGHDDLIGSATFAQIGGDETPDVIIGGRRGALVAIDGFDGSVLWSFDDQDGRWFNFYTNQIIPDQNNDGKIDLAVANGGLVFDEPSEQAPGQEGPRKVGRLFIISGADGSVIASVPVPDQRESYMSALVIGSAHADILNTGTADTGTADSELAMLVGTGGETLPGSLWRIPLASVVNGTTDGAEQVLSGDSKGIIATPSLANMTDDCTADIVIQAFDGTVSAVDGASGERLWQVPNPGYETYSSPTLGYFVGDDLIPDVFTAVARGVWPRYTESDYLLIDGATGEVRWRQTLGTFAPSGFVAADLDGDGRDEVIFSANNEAENSQQVYLLDTGNREPADRQPNNPREDGTELYTLLTLDQTTFSAPWIGDLDGDGLLDLVLTESAYQASGPAVIRRFSLGLPAPPRVSWGGYLGTDSNGRLDR